MDFLGTLVSQAAEALGPEATPDEISRTEENFERLAQEVASRAEPAGAGFGGEEGAAEQAFRSIEVNDKQIQVALNGLCPGFFPIC